MNEENRPNEIDINDERSVRIAKAEELAAMGHEPYPPNSGRTHTTQEALALAEGASVCVAGRLMSKREFGKLTFCVLQDGSGSVQVAFKADDLGEEPYALFIKKADIGDIVEVSGTRFVTHKGEQSVLAASWHMLNKVLRPLPDKYHGIQEKELRFRKRYLDLIMNREVFELFKTRSKIVTLIREFLNGNGFLEVETPVLQVLYGGTNARPFSTHINAYNMPMYLRVAPELYLKRLLVGGYERIYELGKNFRNEGVDQTHNPEFTMMEWYEAYTDYQGMMNRAEALYKFIAKHLYPDMMVPVGDHQVNFDSNWPRVRMVDAIKQHVGIDVMAMSDEELKAFCDQNNIGVRGAATKGQLIMEVFERKVTDKLLDPIWIIDYPREVSPLSRQHREDPAFVERFECYIMGKEIGDGWSEIINPMTQRDRFENEQKNMREGNEESHPMDEDFLESLEYGMPPMGGIGIGIDRLTMLFTNKWSIREVLFFPIMKPEDAGAETE